MRLNRAQSHLSYRRRRRSGCLSLPLLLGLLLGIGGMALLMLGRLGGFRSASPPQSPASLSAAQDAFDRGDLDTAIAVSRQLIAAQPDDGAALALLARALVYRSYTDYNRSIDRSAALEATTTAIAQFPRDGEIQAAHAFALQANGQPVAAAQVAGQALDQQADNALARTALALAYGAVGSFDIALRESARAAELPNGQLDALRAMAISYSDLGDYPKAIATLERAMRLNNRLLPLYFERALYAMQIGDADAATVAYFQVLTYQPDNVKARLRLCELSSLLREGAAAVDYCTQVTQRAPDWSDGWYQLGREYFLQGNYAAARDNLRQCAALQVEQNVAVAERRFECWYLQGQAAEILGDCATLLATYQEFRSMAATANLRQTWTYPPEGPSGCVPTPLPRTNGYANQ